SYPSTTSVYPLSLHDALPISVRRDRDLLAEVPLTDLARAAELFGFARPRRAAAREHPRAALKTSVAWRTDDGCVAIAGEGDARRSEEHTSELQSQSNLVCRLL